MPAVDRIAGYAPTVTVSGNNIVFGAYDLDAAWVDGIATDGSHYLYNVTDNNTKAITGVSGTEATGYTFTVADATGWATGERVCPIRQNTGYQYATAALLLAAATAGDTALCFSANAGCMVLLASPAAAGTTVVLNWWGGYAQRRAGFANTGTASNANCLAMIGNLSGLATQATVQNLTIAGGYWGVCYNDTNGGGGGVRVSRCTVIHSTSIGIYIGAGGANESQVDNCELLYCAYGIYTQVASLCYNNSAFKCILYAYDNTNQASTWTNCYACGSGTGDWQRVTNATITYCADSDSTLPVATGNLRGQTAAQFAFWHNTDGGHFNPTCRLLTSSVCYGAGTAVTGIDTDIEGNSITSSRPIGCHVGTTNAFGVTWPAANQVLDDGTANDFVNFDGAQEASYIPTGGGGVPVIGGHIVRRG